MREVDVSEITTEKQANAIEAAVRIDLKKDGLYSLAHERKVNSFIPKAEEMADILVSEFKKQSLKECDIEISSIPEGAENFEEIKKRIQKKYSKRIDDQKKVHFTEAMNSLTIDAGLRVKINPKK